MIEQYNLSDTIYAVSSGLGKGGVAVVRVSGNRVSDVLKTVAHLEKPKARYAYFKPLYRGEQVLDQALVLYFAAPHSFTAASQSSFVMVCPPSARSPAIDDFPFRTKYET